MSTETSNFQIEKIDNKAEIAISLETQEVRPTVSAEEKVTLLSGDSNSPGMLGAVVLTDFGEVCFTDVVPGQSKLVAHRPWLGPILARMKKSDWAL